MKSFIGLIFGLTLAAALAETAASYYIDVHDPVYDVEVTRFGLDAKVPSPNPILHFLQKGNFQGEYMGVTLKLNSDGFRDGEYGEKGSAYRYVFLGDLLTLGWGVEKSEIFEALLEKRLGERSPVEIINMAMGNHNTERSVELFLAKGLKYEPDHVCLFYFINDAEKTSPPLPFDLLARSKAATMLWSKVNKFRATILRERNYFNYYKELYSEGSAGWKTAKESLLKLKGITDGRGIRLQVVIVPELHQLQPYAFEKEHALLRSFLGENGFDYLDITPFFSYAETQSLWVAKDDAHPNARAHEMIADAVESFVQVLDTSKLDTNEEAVIDAVEDAENKSGEENAELEPNE